MEEYVRNELKTWLEENFPRSEIPSLMFCDEKTKRKLIDQKAKAYKERTKSALKWREDLASRIGVSDDDIRKCTNTIVELMEKTLVKGHKVRITNFGDMKTRPYKDMRLVNFRCDENYVRSINDPIFADEIGLYYKRNPTEFIRKSPKKKRKKKTTRT